MADISSREIKKRRLKNNMLSSDEEYSSNEERLIGIKKDKRKTRRVILIILLVLAVILVTAFVMVRKYYEYSTYDVGWEKNLDEGSLVGYSYYESNIIKYSRDGASYIDDTGNDVWIDSYEMNNPTISVNHDYAAIADAQGTNITIYNKDGKTGTATALLPITKIAVSATGVVAAILEDTKASYITFFDKDGTSIDITIKSILSGDGYPTDLSLSPDGTQLIVSYQYLNNGELSGRVIFYDFSEIGRNIPNRLVGGFDEQFTNSLVANVEYINSTYSVAIADTGLYFFSSKNLASPEIIKTIISEDAIQSILISDEYVGAIYKNSAGEYPYRFEIYKPDGNKVCEKDFDFEYNSADINQDFIILYSNADFRVYNMSGIEKISQKMDYQVMKISKGPWPAEFIAAGLNKMQSLKFR